MENSMDKTLSTCIGMLVVIGGLVLYFFTKPGPVKEINNSGSSEVIINGYSYHMMQGYYKGYMAPTPETIKRCLREVLEGEGKQGGNLF